MVGTEDLLSQIATRVNIAIIVISQLLYSTL